MSLVARSNMASMRSSRELSKTSRTLSRLFAQVSSGKQIERAADNASGISIATDLETRHQSLRMAIRSANDGVSVVQTAETAAEEITDLLQRMRELATQSASETLSDDERAYIEDEYTELDAEIGRIAQATEFDNQVLTGTGVDTQLQVQVSYLGLPITNQVTLRLQDLSTIMGSLGTVSTATDALDAMDLIDTALDQVNDMRGQLGAAHERLENAMAVGESTANAMAESESHLMDLDFAEATAELARLQILQQANIGALAQARNLNQGVVSLLQ
jgi:flagellin